MIWIWIWILILMLMLILILILMLMLMLLERLAARPMRRGRGSRRSYPCDRTPLRCKASALLLLRVPRSRLTPLLQWDNAGFGARSFPLATGRPFDE
ncbi:hypothetical protein GLA29479_1080 [Lysobacter antibioticus]|nr:hypothetical protein GLA29479_1080 [Lysobacter antibioticus]